MKYIERFTFHETGAKVFRMQSLKKYEITDSRRREIQDIIFHILNGKKEITFAYLYGSFLENFFRDVDVAVYLGKELTKRDVLHFELALESELEEKTGFPADVRILNYSPLPFRFKVFKDGYLLLTRDERIRTDFECLTIVEHHDFNFYRKRYRREALGLEV